MARVVICARSPASSEAVPCLLASTVKRVGLTSEFAKRGAVSTAAVRDSMYSPDTCPAGWAALAQEGRATNAPARSNDDAARFTFIVAASVDWPKDFFEPQTYFPTPAFS